MEFRPIRIALVGDFDETVTAHRAIPRALALAAEASGRIVHPVWLPTERITSEEVLASFDAVWCVPASPYRSTEGALRAIRWARENGVPYLGTCGGFQHAILEYARSVLGWDDASHAENTPGAGRAVVSELACALEEVRSVVRFRPGSRLAEAYGADQAVEGYHCRYGLNPDVRAALTGGPLRVAAEDEDGDVRAVELDDHPFFVATLFQPERAALEGTVPPIAAALVDAAAAQRGTLASSLADR